MNTVSDNVAFDNTQHGLVASCNTDISGCCDNNIWKNNISDGNDATNMRELYVNNGCSNNANGTGNVYEYNAFGAERSGMFAWNGTIDSTYDAFITTSSQNDNNAEGDPLFVNNNFVQGIVFWFAFKNESGITQPCQHL